MGYIIEYSFTNLIASVKALMHLFLGTAYVIFMYFAIFVNILLIILLITVVAGAVNILRAGRKRMCGSNPGRK